MCFWNNSINFINKIICVSIKKINNSKVGNDGAANKENFKNIENIFRLMGIAALHENGEWYLKNSREKVEHPVESP